MLMVIFRYLNIDYTLASTLVNDIHAGIEDIVVTYDIACQWEKNPFTRLPAYSTILPISLDTLKSFHVAVLKLHLIGHSTSCQATFNLAFMDSVGMTHGVRTTQRMTQSVLTLRAPVLRGRTGDRLHTLKEERRERRYAVNVSESKQIDILPWGSR